MRTRFFQLPGVPFVSIGLQTGLTKGIEIDNSSGSWLYIPSLETFIPPYIIGWSYDFPYGVSSIEIVPQDGPAGQVSTIQGTGVTVYLSDASVGLSSGSPDLAAIGAAGSPDPGASYIQGFTPQLNAITQVDSTAAGATVAFISAVTGKRVRLRTLGVSFIPFSPIIGTQDSSSPCQVRLVTTPVTSYPLAFLLTVEHPTDFRAWDNGMDFPIDQGVNVLARGIYANNTCLFVATYERI